MIKQASSRDKKTIVLITDFGERDYFVGLMKGVILNINPDVNIVDLTHSIPSFNIKICDFVLSNCYHYFPKGTIFVVVVDPGVGSKRKILLVKTKNYYFIAPDNGVLTSVLEKEKPFKIFSVENKKYFLKKVSATFHGRDIFSPVAGWLSLGVPCEEFGPSVSSFNKLDIESPKIDNDRVIGEIVYIDKFGNAITNIGINTVKDYIKDKQLKLKLGDNEIPVVLRNSYSEGRKDEIFLIEGSLNYIEIASNKLPLAQKLNAKEGERIEIKWK
ncbi:SAM-dependent chlorinase/fluorinase [Candidatus Aminicenantes bacterium AC-335-K20]|nr:SAM-dependent chlorinase/fluorinase [SCandidatus Aminicenantes bacterium Aminicenantia_JdfR_composite]MCP2619189.1 SAM-dependent chlorinase/fluorinase [Candidatus Aminicenantes bacterium AC-335-K20]